MLHIVGCRAIGLTLRKSGILHRDFGRGVFTERPVGKRIILGYQYGSPVYENRSSSWSRFNTYEESIMEVTRDKFPEWTSLRLETAMDKDMAQHPV